MKQGRMKQGRHRPGRCGQRAGDGAHRPLYAELCGHGPPVLLLHGQPGTGRDWQWVVPMLEDTFTVIVADRPGYGRTGGSATGFVGNAEAAVDLLDHLGIDGAILVAHSWAGGAALAIAQTYPERVRGLVLVASVAPVERLSWGDRLMAAPVIGELVAGLAMIGVMIAVRSRRVQSVANRRLAGRASDAIAAAARMAGTNARAWMSFLTEQRAMVDELPGLAAGLVAIRSPTRILNGDADRVVPPDSGARLEQAIPGATRVLVPGVGHQLPHDRPAAIADAVRLIANSDDRNDGTGRAPQKDQTDK